MVMTWPARHPPSSPAGESLSSLMSLAPCCLINNNNQSEDSPISWILIGNLIVNFLEGTINYCRRRWRGEILKVRSWSGFISFQIIIENKQTYRQTDIQTHRHTDIQTNGHTDIQTNRHTDIQTNGHTDIQTDIQMHKQTYRQTDLRTNKPTL